MRLRVASRSRRQSPKGDVTGPHGMLPMVARAVDDNPSDTLVVGSRQTVLDGEFDSPPSPPNDQRQAPTAEPEGASLCRSRHASHRAPASTFHAGPLKPSVN